MDSYKMQYVNLFSSLIIILNVIPLNWAIPNSISRYYSPQKDPVVFSQDNKVKEETLSSSWSPALSADGRIMVFSSNANDLIRGDFNQKWDIFILDLQTQDIDIVSVSSGGVQANSDSSNPSISADGNIIAFQSWADNLVSEDKNGCDIFIHDQISNQTELISVLPDGTPVNGNSQKPSISGDGRFVAFESMASNLISNDTNQKRDIYVYDRQSMSFERVSIDGKGRESNGNSFQPVISSDGRTVAFASDATNLVANDTNQVIDIFIHDRVTGDTSRVSVGQGEQQLNSVSEYPSISGDGRFVAYQSWANPTNPQGKNGLPNIFVYDREAETVELISQTTSGQQGNSSSQFPAISNDGQFVLFSSHSNNLLSTPLAKNWKSFLFDRKARSITLIPLTEGREPGCSTSIPPAISGDGQTIAQVCDLSTPVIKQQPGTLSIFTYQQQSKLATTLHFRNRESENPSASINASIQGKITDEKGVPQSNVIISINDGYNVVTDSNGEYTLSDLPANRYTISAFKRGYTTNPDFLTINIPPGAINQDFVITPLVDKESMSRVVKSYSGEQANSYSTHAVCSDDGQKISFESSATNLIPKDANGSTDIFVSNLDKGNIELASIDTNGRQGNNNSNNPTISADGRFIAFESDATNLIQLEDTNGWSDIFVHDMKTGETELISIAPGNIQTNASSSRPSISGDGRYIAYESQANNLVEKSVNNPRTSGIFIFDRHLRETKGLTPGIGGEPADCAAHSPVISGNGRFVTFESCASNLVSGDTNNKISNIFVADVQSGKIERISVSSKGDQANGSSNNPAISYDGRFVTFWSSASNLVQADTNGLSDIFLFDRQTRQIERISISSDQAQSNGQSLYASPISSDGRYVAFTSGANNLVNADTNGKFDVFLRDRSNSSTRRVSIPVNNPQTNGDSILPVMTTDGKYILFQSGASNIMPNKNNGITELFIINTKLPGQSGEK